MTGDVVYRVRAVSQGWGGAPGLNQFYFKLPSGEDPASGISATECATRVHSAFTAVVDMWPSLWTVQVSNIVDAIDTDNSALIASNAVASMAPVAGVNNNGFGPQVAMVNINLLTADIIDGHRVRGRIFLGPLSPDNDTDGTPNAQIISRANSFATMLEANGTTNATFSVWSRRRKVSLRHPTGLGGSAHLVVAHSVRDTFAFLSSRRQ